MDDNDNDYEMITVVNGRGPSYMCFPIPIKR